MLPFLARETGALARFLCPESSATESSTESPILLYGSHHTIVWESPKRAQCAWFGNTHSVHVGIPTVYTAPVHHSRFWLNHPMRHHFGIFVMVRVNLRQNSMHPGCRQNNRHFSTDRRKPPALGVVRGPSEFLSEFSIPNATPG